MSKRIVQERLLEAPVERVFAAWSDAGSMATWMAPGPEFGRARVELDFRVGGRFEIVMQAEGSFRQSGEYLEIVPQERIVFTWISDFVPPAEAETRVTVEFESVSPEKTRLRLVHDGLPDTETYDGHEQGWAHILGRLAGALGSTR